MAGQVSSHGGGRRWTPSLGSGFSREIEAHCWRLSHGVSQGEQRPLGAQAPRFIWGSPRGFRKMSLVGQIRFDSGLGTCVSDPRWPLEQSQEGGLSPAALDRGPESPQRPPRDIGRQPAPHLRTWARARVSGLSAPTRRAEQRMFTNTIEATSVQAGGMKHLHPVVPPSPLSTPQTLPPSPTDTGCPWISSSPPPTPGTNLPPSLGVWPLWGPHLSGIT